LKFQVLPIPVRAIKSKRLIFLNNLELSLYYFIKLKKMNMSRLAKKICFKSSNAKAVVIENKDLNNGKGLTYHI